MVNGPGEIPERIIAPITPAPSVPINTSSERRTTPEADRTAQAADRVELSPRAREVQNLVRAVQSEAEVRNDTVAEIIANQTREFTDATRPVQDNKAAVRSVPQAVDIQPAQQSAAVHSAQPVREAAAIRSASQAEPVQQVSPVASTPALTQRTPVSPAPQVAAAESAPQVAPVQTDVPAAKVAEQLLFEG